MAPKNQDRRMQYPFQNLQDLFLLNEPTFFTANGDGYCTSQKMREILAVILSTAQLDEDAANIQDNTAVQNLSMSAAFVENGGGYMVHGTYEHGGQKKFAMAAIGISHIDTREGKFPFYSIHYILTGDVVDVKGQPTLMVNHTTCRAILDSGEAAPLTPHNLESFYAFLCYGRTLLKQLVGGAPIDTLQNQFWLQPAAIQVAESELEHYLSVKTLQDLLAEIAFDNYARQSHKGVDTFPTRFPN